MKAPVLPEEVRQQMEKNRREDTAARKALADPLPGPLKTAYAPNQDIRVGRWLVGPFRDRHYQWLALLEHPLEKVQTAELIATVTGRPVWVLDDALWERAKASVTIAWSKKKGGPDTLDMTLFWSEVEEAYIKSGGHKREVNANDVYIPRGPSMWQLAYICTHPVSQTKELVQKGGMQAVKDAAETEFGECAMQELLALYLAIDKQMDVYWSTAVNHEEIVPGLEGSGTPDGSANPPPS